MSPATGKLLSGYVVMFAVYVCLLVLGGMDIGPFEFVILTGALVIAFVVFTRRVTGKAPSE